MVFHALILGFKPKGLNHRFSDFSRYLLVTTSLLKSYLEINKKLDIYNKDFLDVDF